MESTAGNDRDELTGTVIASRDIEELESSVFPWQLDMRQVSSGTLDARIRLGQVGDILVTREHWSHRVVAAGATPSGFLALSGLGSKRSFKWCGYEIDSRHLVCGLDAAEVDFATPNSADHWVVLIPRELLADYLGEETVEALRGRRVLGCEPNLARRLLALSNRAVTPSGRVNAAWQGHSSTKSLRAELLEAAAQLVVGDDRNRDDSGPRRSYQKCCRAIAYMSRIQAPVGVPELASAVGVNRRTLERAFRETLGISPYRFLRLHRLNRLRRELRSARVGERTVTELANDWGFTELGRTAVDYKGLFGESPSATLAEGPSPPSLRLADALVVTR